MSKLTQQQILTRAKPVTTIIAYAGEIIDVPNGGLYPSNMHAYKARTLLTDGTYRAAAKTVCDEIVGRSFKDVDAAINKLAEGRYPADLSDYYPKSFSVGPAKIAMYVAWLCKELGLYWDDSEDSIASVQEITNFKNSMLGQALLAEGCYTVAQAPATRTRAASTGVAGQPKNGYKQSGPQSQFIRDLKGTAGNKTTLNKVYRIYSGIKDKCIFVKPHTTENPNGNEGTTNKLFFGAGHGYTECEVFFADNVTADDFLVKVKGSSVLPAAVQQTAIVVETKPLPNGYFIVGTPYGDVYISASKFNEELEGKIIDESLEALQEEEKALPRVNRKYRKTAADMMEYLKEELPETGDPALDDPVQFEKDLIAEY